MEYNRKPTNNPEILNSRINGLLTRIDEMEDILQYVYDGMVEYFAEAGTDEECQNRKKIYDLIVIMTNECYGIINTDSTSDWW